MIRKLFIGKILLVIILLVPTNCIEFFLYGYGKPKDTKLNDQ